MWWDTTPDKIPDFSELAGRDILYCLHADVVEMGGKPHFFPKPASVAAATRDTLATNDGTTLNRKDLAQIFQIGAHGL